jgi:putative drug exporter of the RND superfamily
MGSPLTAGLHEKVSHALLRAGGIGMFASFARMVVRHPWWIVGVWVVVAVVSLLLSPSLAKYTNANQSAFLPSSFESVKAQNVIDAKFPAQSGASGLIVVSRKDGAALTSQDQSAISALGTMLSNDHIPGVRSVTVNPILLSSNKKVFLVSISFTQPPGATVVNNAVPTIRSDTTSFFSAKDPALKGGLTGSAAIQVDSTNAYDSAEKVISIATVVLIVVLLGIIFRSPLICATPLVIILLVHQMTTAFVADLAGAFGFQVSQILPPLLIVVLFGVGTDYIVFLLFRYRERMRTGEDPKQSLENALASISQVVGSAALTVAAAFAALLLADLGSLQTLAPGLITAVLVMMLAALTLVPAIFSLLGSHLFWPTGVGVAKESKRARRLGMGIGRHPGRYVAGFGILLLALACGALAYKPTYNTLQELPKSTPSLVAYNTMESAFPPGSLGPTQIVVNGTTPLASNSLTSLTNKLKATKGVAELLPTQYSSDHTAAIINVVLKDNPYSTAALDELQYTIRPEVIGSVPGYQVYGGGTTASLVDVRTSLGQSTAEIFPVALAIIGIILGLLLLAIAAPLYLLIGVALAYVGTLGVTSLVFITLGGLSGVDFSTPIVLYLFVLAIGTDYNIAVSHRLREELLEDHPPGEAALVAATHAAPMVDSAAIILAGTFASLMLTGIASLTELGFGVAIGIVITAFVLATRLVPAVSCLRRWHFWWPSGVHHRTADAIPTVRRGAERTTEPAGAT